jgi:hypothetical protein
MGIGWLGSLALRIRLSFVRLRAFGLRLGREGDRSDFLIEQLFTIVSFDVLRVVCNRTS